MSSRHDESRREKRRRDDGDDDAPNLQDVNIQDSGGEISMSIEDTNKMRIALGLKPLKLDSGPSKPAKEASKEPAKPSKPSADEIREKIKQSRDKRRAEELLAAKPLGAADQEDDDDVYAWVQKTRTKPDKGGREEGERPSKATRRGKRKKDTRRRADDEASSSSEEEGERYTAEELAGMKVRHDYKELGDGEMMVLTLADKNLLDDKGELMEDGDELENVLKAEDKRRKKARDAAQKKAKPLFEEDGKRRSLLDKYDEEEEEMIRLGDDATLEARKQEVKEEVRKKLAAGVEELEASAKANADYYTNEEMATMFKKKKRKKDKKIRQKPQNEEEEEGGDTAAILEALEAEAELRQEGKSNDLGKRGDRLTARERAAAEEAARVQERRERFDKALEKANWAAQALKKESKAATNDADEEDEADRELYESLARARRAAAKEAAARTSKLEEVAEMIAKNREEDEKKLLDKSQSAGVLEFTETREFIHTIQPSVEEQPVVSAKPVKMEIDEKPDPVVKDESEGAGDGASGSRRGKWVSADKARIRDKDDKMDVSDEEDDNQEKKEEDLGLTGQKAIGKGLAGCLGLLKETGQLQQKLQWAGRTNDKKKTQLMGLDDVYTGGLSEDRIALDIEVALTQKDEYGRILTPKERFRDLSYRFHGKGPSKNKQEKRMKQAADEIARRKAATSENPNANIDQMRDLYAKAGAPYVVLQGKDSKPPATSSKTSKQASTSNKATMKTPVLGGGYTPLTDPQRKVQAMYGIKPEASGSMLPPPPRKPPPAS